MSFYIWGFYEFTFKTNDKVPNTGIVHCAICENFDDPIFIRVVDCFHICFIPIFPFKFSKIPGCANCKSLFNSSECRNCMKFGYGRFCSYCGNSMV